MHQHKTFRRMAPLAMAAAALASACTTTPAPESDYVGDPAQGRDLAERLCASCHSIEATGASPRSDAPPLRTVLAGYPADELAATLQDAKHVAFLRMPAFHLGEHGGADLVAYIASINEQ